jgi:hypothetical protein
MADSYVEEQGAAPAVRVGCGEGRLKLSYRLVMPVGVLKFSPLFTAVTDLRGCLGQAVSIVVDGASVDVDDRRAAGLGVLNDDL